MNKLCEGQRVSRRGPQETKSKIPPEPGSREPSFIVQSGEEVPGSRSDVQFVAVDIGDIVRFRYAEPFTAGRAMARPRVNREGWHYPAAKRATIFERHPVD